MPSDKKDPRGQEDLIHRLFVEEYAAMRTCAYCALGDWGLAETAVQETFVVALRFREKLGGESFLNGMYRLFRKDQLEKWTGIVEQAFPAYRGRIDVFGFDWFGQVYAIDKNSGTVLWLQPGTGDVFDIPDDFVAFHDVEIVENPENALVSRYYEYWFENNGQ